uniref:Transposase n=1 Tax=Timema shepardi TaxID=629360 RepID=A0A7R9AVN6_TIMSH|nr:unnamed protein product [Timema shepardi]
MVRSTDKMFGTGHNKPIRIGRPRPNSKGWRGLWKSHILGQFFLDRSVTGETYLIMLGDQIMPQINVLGKDLPECFQKDGAPAHHATVSWCCFDIISSKVYINCCNPYSLFLSLMMFPPLSTEQRQFPDTALGSSPDEPRQFLRHRSAVKLWYNVRRARVTTSGPSRQDQSAATRS